LVFGILRPYVMGAGRFGQEPGRARGICVFGVFHTEGLPETWNFRPRIPE